MPEETSEPVAPALASSPGQNRTALLLGVGGAVGLAVGILLSMGAYTTYTFITQTVPSTVESVQVFNELNELRQQVNALNEQRKLKDAETAEAVRKALSTVATNSAVATNPSPPESKSSAVGPTAKKKERRPPGIDPFADIDAEIEDLERTQKTLNTILDLFTPKKKEAAKDG
jgi:hypothetical protein